MMRGGAETSVVRMYRMKEESIFNKKRNKTNDFELLSKIENIQIFLNSR